jgi:hypothetical protein
MESSDVFLFNGDVQKLFYVSGKIYDRWRRLVLLL